MGPRLNEGMFVKLRHAYPDPKRIWRAFSRPRSQGAQFCLNDRVVVVGLGPAAMSCLLALKREGFKNVTVVAQDRMYGGKCVNFGCMPIEFSFAVKNQPVDQRGRLLQDFVASLRSDVQNQFEGLDYPLFEGRALSVKRNCLELDGGRTVEFDKLILAIGNSLSVSSDLFSGLSNRISIEDFWGLPAGSRVAFYLENNITALALGDVARNLGMIPTVLLSGDNPLSAIPSYRYFVREMGKRLPVHDQVRMRKVSGQNIDFECQGKVHSLNYDYLVLLGKPEPKFIEIDGVVPNLYDLDLTHSSLPSRPDILFMGDGAGFLTYSEADMQARMLIRSWKHGQDPDFRILDKMPVCVHGEKALAMVGPGWAYSERKWTEVDFRTLGWSKVHGLEGKVWFLLNDQSGKVDALHICHKNAGELICLGAALMEYPVWDQKWMSGALHPSGAEIFKVVAEQATALLPERNAGSLLTNTPRGQFKFFLPPVYDVHPGSGLPEWINEKQYYQTVLSKDPLMFFAAYFGLFKYAGLVNSRFDGLLEEFSPDQFRLIGDPTLLIEVDQKARVCNLKSAEIKISIDTQETL